MADVAPMRRLSLPDLLILRHGETEWNRAGRLQGALDSPLTEKGRVQAQAQGRILSEAGAANWDWVASPQPRAYQTARIAKGTDQGLRTDARLREIEMGDWTGLSRAEILAQTPGAFSGPHLGWYDTTPGGEGIAALARRVAAFLGTVSAPTVIVTHGITSRVLRCLACGRPVSDFGEVEGGQGIVYHLSGGKSIRLAEPSKG